jgi:DNA-binding protein YbaB
MEFGVCAIPSCSIMDLAALARGFAPIQDSMKAAQARRAGEAVEGTAGGGAVKLRLRGDLTVAGVTIAPAAAQASAHDPSMLEDLVTAALGDALRQHKQRYGGTVEEQFSKMLAGADLGAMMGMFGQR